MPKVSVIMPCLNMIRYISECMESVVGQSLKDIEILVIDAGSIDGTLQILDDYVKKDSRVKLIHSERKSYGYQVNLGIAEATGEYIAIVDTDDRILPDMYEKLCDIAAGTGAEYVKGTTVFFYTIAGKYDCKNKSMPFRKEEYGENGIEVAPKEMPELLMKDPYLWNGIYKKELLKKIKLHESPGAAYQDLGGLLQTQLYAVKAVYIEDAVYEYRQDNFSASGYSPKAFEWIVNEYDWSKRFLEGQQEEWHTAFYRKLFIHTMARFRCMAESGTFWPDAGKAMLDIADRLCRAIENGIIKKEDFEKIHWEQLQVFLRSPEELYARMAREHEQEKAEPGHLLQMAAGRETVIFGGGKLGGFLHLLMLNNGIGNVAAFCDSKDALEGTALQGLEVLNPKAAASRYPDALYIIANRKHADEMKEQLIQFGINEKNIVSYAGGINLHLFRELFIIPDASKC